MMDSATDQHTNKLSTKAIHETPKSRVTAILLVSLLITIVTTLPGYRSLLNPWCEDGILLLGAWMHGFSETFIPFLDGFFVIPRTLAWSSVLLSPINAPLLSSIFALSMQCCLALYLLRPSFNWMFRSDILRFSVCLAVVLGAGTHNMAGSVICTSYFCALMMVFLLLEKPLLPAPLLVGACWILSLSSNLAFTSILLVLVRRRELGVWPALLILAGVATSIIAPQLLVSTVEATLFPLSIGSISDILKTTLVVSNAVTLLTPFIGFFEFLPENSPHIHLLLMVLSSTILLALGILLGKMDRQRRLIALSLFLSAIVYCIARKLKRHYHHDTLPFMPLVGMDRASFLPQVFSLLGWAIATSGEELVGIRRHVSKIAASMVAFQTALSCLVLAILLRLLVPTLTIAGDWRKFALTLAQTQERAVFLIDRQENNQDNAENAFSFALVCDQALENKRLCDVIYQNREIYHFEHIGHPSL